MRKVEQEQQLQMLQVQHPQELALAQARVTSQDNSSGQDISKSLKLLAFDERREDIDAYLHRYEQFAEKRGWSRDEWAFNLSTLLRGSALEVYYRMDKADQKSYDKLKKQLLRKFRFTVVEFRDKFRTSKPNKDESFGEYVTRLAGYFNGGSSWVEPRQIMRTYVTL